MKIVNIIGGLGNQMFEFAMFLALKNKHPEEKIKVCTRSFKGYGLHNGFELNRIFNVDFNEASLIELCMVAYPIFNYRAWQIQSHYLPKRKSMVIGTMDEIPNPKDIEREASAYYDGYWQDENVFKNIRGEILKCYTFPPLNDKNNLILSKTLKSKKSVSIHIRRGDYLKDPVMCVCTTEYYQRAISYIKEKEQVDLFCVFSDDISWCKENLKEMVGDIEIEYVDWNIGNDSYKDMQLMTYCKHNIIANSSFSWWGAWLGCREGKIVIAPKIWANKKIVNDPICESWIRI